MHDSTAAELKRIVILVSRQMLDLTEPVGYAIRTQGTEQSARCSGLNIAELMETSLPHWPQDSIGIPQHSHCQRQQLNTVFKGTRRETVQPGTRWFNTPRCRNL
jgi:hypothetical protein